MKTILTISIIIITALALLSGQAVAQDKTKTGTISGTVYDFDTKSSLIGTNIILEGTVKGATSDVDGKFVIKDVPVGSYSLRFSYIGYDDKIQTDIIVRSERITNVYVEMRMSSFEIDEIKVTAGYFQETNDQPVSVTSFSYEEIRRSPGSAGDVSRIMMSLPSVAKVNDQSNGLIVRGGSPMENAFYVDNIEIPNINHFPTQGATSGPLGLINGDFINSVSFMSGGFSAMYGDKLSSVMEMNFREGNRTEFDGQLDLNFSGFGGVFEGPLFNGNGSWLFSARRSYLDLLVKAADVGSTIAPVYGDYQGKFVYDINKNNQITLLGIFGDDHNDPDAETAIENDMIHYGNQDIYESTAGINWRALWGETGYSNTSVSYTSTKFIEDFYETGSNIFVRKNRSHEQVFKLRNVNHIILGKSASLDFGVDAKYYIDKYDNRFGAFTDPLGNTTPELSINEKINSHKAGIFINFNIKPVAALSAGLGFRADYFSFNENINLSPRASLSYKVNDLLTINAAAGIYYQNLPSVLFSQNEANKNLSDPYAVHYVLGFEQLLTESTKLTLEVYQKDYRNFPVDPTQPDLFLVDELYYSNGYYSNHSSLTDNGEAFSRGIELTIQKKLAKDFYGLISASWFTTQYKDSSGDWRDRVYDNRYIFSVEGGYKPNSEWEFSARWIYAGGVPYTPFDIAASQNLNRGVLDENKINESRYPDYHSLNIRVDKRFHFSGSNLVVYISIWNAYNRKNVATTYWNQIENKPEEIYQWGILPIFGVEYEF